MGVFFICVYVFFFSLQRKKIDYVYLLFCFSHGEAILRCWMRIIYPLVSFIFFSFDSLEVFLADGL